MILTEITIPDLSLADLWKSIPAMGLAQLSFVYLIIFTILIVILARLFKPQIIKLVNQKSQEKFSAYPWPSEEMIYIHNLPDKLAKTDKECKEFKEMLLHQISRLRNENISGKQYLIDMSKTIFMSGSIRKMFTEIAEDSIKLNIVRLIYVIPKIRKSKKLNETEKFYVEMKNLCKKLNKPGSWVIKEGINLKLFS